VRGTASECHGDPAPRWSCESSSVPSSFDAANGWGAVVDSCRMEPTILGSVRPVVRGGRVSVVGDERTSIEVGAAPCIVGRDPNCQLVLHDKRVSATHFELVATEHGLRVRDLGSKNGILVGACRVLDALLTEPTQIRCGDTVLQYEPGKPQRVALSPTDEFGPLVGGTPHMRALFARLKRLAQTDLSVLICGETGTGKELVAKAIHQASRRAKQPFTVIDCGGIPQTLAESILFGHEKGAFTGADQRRKGALAEADGGTVFLDELGELPMDLQPKLLRAVAEREIKAVGSSKYVSIDVRIIAATWRDLPREIAGGGFRSDLFFRLADERIELPSLRQRLDDIPLLAQRMMTDEGKGSAFDRVTPASLDHLAQYGWPGNVRELKSVVRRALSYDDGGPMDLAQYLSPEALLNEPTAALRLDAGLTYEASKTAHDAAYFTALFEATGGNIREMARRSGVYRDTVRAQLKRHRIKVDGARRR
jgi:DNA-binding NtrC family response regulator